MGRYLMAGVIKLEWASALMSGCHQLGQKTLGASQGTHLSGQGQRQMATLQLSLHFYFCYYPKQSNYSFLSLMGRCFHDY